MGPPSSFSMMEASGRWLSRLRNEGVEKESFEPVDGVFPSEVSNVRFLPGVTKDSRRYRFPADAGVLLCLRDRSAVLRRGVACVESFEDVIASFVNSGDMPSPCSMSKRPRTKPSF